MVTDTRKVQSDYFPDMTRKFPATFRGHAKGEHIFYFYLALKISTRRQNSINLTDVWKRIDPQMDNLF